MAAWILHRKEGRYSAYFFGNPTSMFEITSLTSERVMIPYLMPFVKSN